MVTSLNTSDKWRISKLEGKNPSKQSKKETPKEAKGVDKDGKKEVND